MNITVTAMMVLWQITHVEQCLAYGKTCVDCGKTGHFKKACHSRRERAVNEIEVEVPQEYSEGEIETVNIDPVHLNKKLVIINGRFREACRC